MKKDTLITLTIIIICISIDVSWAIFNFIIPILFWGLSADLVPFIMGNVITDWLIIFYAIPLFTLPLYIIVAGIMAKWFVLPINQFLNPGKEALYIAPPTPTPQPIWKLLRRSIFAVVVMFGIALTISKFFNLSFITYDPRLPAIVNQWNQSAVLMPLLFPFLALILVPSWLIEDSNLVFHSYSSHGPQEIRSAGTTLTTLLKGYSGIFVLLDYIVLATQISGTATLYHEAFTWVPLWLFYLVTFLNPFIYLYIPLFGLLLYRKVFTKLRDQLNRYTASKEVLSIDRLLHTE